MVFDDLCLKASKCGGFFLLMTNICHFKRAHHIVIFVLKDVAVPNISAAVRRKGGDNARH